MNRTDMPATSDPAETPAPGVLLVRAREKQGISEQHMCQHLGLTRRVLRALETDDYERLPSPVFVRGYVRNYCQVVKLRPGPLLAAFETRHNAAMMARQPVQIHSGRSPFAVVAGSLCACVMASTLVFWTLYSEGKEFSPLRATLVDNLPAAEEKHSAKRRQGGNATGISSLRGNGPLLLEFHADSWVEVIDDNDHILAVDLYRAGTRLQLDGKPPFRVTLGHGPGVKVTFEGKSVTFDSDPETLAANMTVGR